MVTFYHCTVCGNMLETIEDSGNTPVCCRKTMRCLEAASTDGAKEKHIPVISQQEHVLTVCVGEQLHPMDYTHYIQWISVCTDKGYYRRDLHPLDSPTADFCLYEDETVKMIYAYCNLHGLWVLKL